MTEYVEDYIQLPPDGVGKKVRAIKRPDNRYEEVTIPLSLNGEVDLKTLLDKLISRLPRKIEADDGTGVYAEIYRTSNALQTSIKSDEVGLAKDGTLSSNLPRKLSLDDGTGVYAEIYRTNNALHTYVKNFPTEYPLPEAQVTDLKKVFPKVVKTTVQKVIDVTIPPEGKRVFTVEGVLDRVGVVYTLKATYAVGAVKGALIKVFWSPDGVEWDNETDEIIEHPFEAGETKQKTYLTVCAPRYMKFEVYNLDTTSDLIISFWADIF